MQQITDSEAVLTLDDTVEAKPYMDQNPLIRFHYDHCQQAAIKGINQLTVLFTSRAGSLPVAYELIEKDQSTTDPKTGKIKWSSVISKQEYFRQLIQQCLTNNLIFKYILADSWFSSVENFVFIASLGQHFIMPLKVNRKVALSRTDQQQGRYQSIESLVFEKHQTRLVWLVNLDFPVLLTKQVRSGGPVQRRRLYSRGALSGDQ